MAMQQFEPPTLDPGPDPSAVDLVREGVAQARHLVKLEVLLAREELKREVAAAKTAAIAFGVCALLLVLGLSLLLVSLALALFPGPVPALVLGLVLSASAALAGIAGMKLLPKKPLGATRQRLERDIETVKERVG